MIIKGIIDEDFVNYREPSMYISFPHCTFKCCKECGKDICQNLPIVKDPDIEVSADSLVTRYLSNPITKAIVCAGLEPLDSLGDLLDLLHNLRSRDCHDTVIIYTGYNFDEVGDKLNYLERFDNIIIKFGRFVPDQESHFDEKLGVNLASPNQYAIQIS